MMRLSQDATTFVGTLASAGTMMTVERSLYCALASRRDTASSRFTPSFPPS